MYVFLCIFFFDSWVLSVYVFSDVKLGDMYICGLCCIHVNHSCDLGVYVRMYMYHSNVSYK